MSALDQLRKKASKREVELKRERKEKEVEERKLQRVKEEAFRTTGAIYIEPLASRLLPIFQESSESYGEERNIKRENFETLKFDITVGGLEETL